MKESQFQREVKKTFEEFGHWCEKFPDSIRSADTRFIPSKPSDLIAVIDGKGILIECKLIKKIGRINKNFFGNTKEKKEKVDFREFHQVKELKRFKDTTGNPAFYYINIRLPRQLNSLIALEIDEFISIFSTKDYISKEEVEEHIYLGIPGAKGMYKNEFFSRHLEFIKKYT